MSFDLNAAVRGRLGRIRTILVQRPHAPLAASVEPSDETVGQGRSLVGRLVAALVVTAVFVYVAAVAGLWWAGGRLLEDSARIQAVQWLGELDELGTPLYASRQRAAAMRALGERLQRVAEIVHVRYYDAGGTEVLGEYRRHEQGALPALTAAERAAARAAPAVSHYRLAALGGARLRVTAPLQVRVLAPDAVLAPARAAERETRKIIGYLDFVFDAGAQWLQFQRSLIAGSVALAFVLCAAVVFGRRWIRQAMAPLTALEEPLARLARGEVNVDVGGGGDREISAIRKALSATLAAIRSREEALRRAESDALTGLVNQRYFLRQLALEHAHVARGGEASAVLCIDLDRFREVNAALGAGAGDRLLGQVAGLLRARVRDNDVLARCEGDEFLALVRGVRRDGALKVARSINHVLQEFQFSADDEHIAISASIGIAMVDGTGVAPEAIVAQAAAACAQAKVRGGNCHYVHDGNDSGSARATDSPAWSRQVRTAIQDDALRFVYQPIVDLHARGGEERYELLLRLATPGGQLVAPTAFLPVADRFGLIAELDRWVVRRACEELARLRAQGRNPTFFVNLSGHVFEQGDALTQAVAEQLALHQITRGHLVFEITEQAAVRQLQRARAVIEDLTELGCRFALDDFGSGFSSLSYLKHLPVAFIKISGTFVQNLSVDALDEVMVRSIVQLARAMRMQTVAESVEDAATLARIAELGVDYAQGHAIARPAEQPLAGRLPPPHWRPARGARAAPLGAGSAGIARKR